MATKNILLLSDFHCGSGLGLTPPKYQDRSPQRKAVTDGWNYVYGEAEKLGKYDYIFFLGDAIEGQQYKERSCGLLTADLNEQVEIAIECFDEFKKLGKRGCRIHGVTGTPYHVDINGTSAERLIADKMKWASVRDRNVVNVDGFRFDMRHKTSKTSNLHTGSNGLQKEANNILTKEAWASHGKIHCLLRGHIHEAMRFWQPNMGYAISLPALQLPGGKYGQQVCDGWVHYGIGQMKLDRMQVIEQNMPIWMIPPAGVTEVMA